MKKPDVEYCAKYPFTEAAREYVGGLGLTLEEILRHPVYKTCLDEGKLRFLDAVGGRIQSSLEDKIAQEVAILSYPITRMIASIVGEPYRTRYAVAEATTAYELFKDNDEDTRKLAKDLNLSFEDGFLEWTEYLTLTERIGKLDCRWLLANRRLNQGRVSIEEAERKDLLAEKIARKVASPLDIKRVPSEVSKVAKELAASLSSAEERTLDGELSDETTPPCIAHLLGLLSTGQTSHAMMFILGTYLAGRGLSEDKIVEVFSKSPNFDENKTRYQLKFLLGERGSTKYSCPTCVKVKSYGLCKRDCGIKHPLQYGRKGFT